MVGGGVDGDEVAEFEVEVCCWVAEQVDVVYLVWDGVAAVDRLV